MATFTVNSGAFDDRSYQISEIDLSNPMSTESSITLPSMDYTYYATGEGFDPVGDGVFPNSGTIYTVERVSDQGSWTLTTLDGLPIEGLIPAIQANATDAFLAELFSGDDVSIGGTENDALRSEAGDDISLGGRGDDYLDGGSGEDWLVGGEGDDQLIGGPGSDVCFGGKGADTFIFAPGDGTDRVADFEDGIDKIGLAGNLGFDDLKITSACGDTLIKVEGECEKLAVLEDVSPNNITEADFILI